MEEGPDLVKDSFNNHVLSMCSVPGTGDTGDQGRLASDLWEHSPMGGSDIGGQCPHSPCQIPLGDFRFHFAGQRGPGIP